MILVTLLLWIPAVLGFGIVLVLVRKRLGAAQTVDYLPEAITGMAVLSVIASGVHFIYSIDHWISTVLALLGLLLCIIRFRFLERKQVRLPALFLLGLWLVFLAFWATQTPRQPDSALYHLQAIKWINQNQLPIGLANLHDRLGLNSFWFPFVAVLQVPWLTREGANALSASTLVVFYFGIEIFQAIRLRHRENLKIHILFLSLVPLLFLSDVFRRSISSPSPDYAILMLCLAITYLSLRFVSTHRDPEYHLLQIVLVAVFAITIKPTAIPLIFVIISLLMFQWKNKILVRWKSFSFFTLMFAGIPILLWLARGIALSGHLNFPNFETALPLFWTVPKPIADHVWLANQTTAKLTYPQELPFREWIGPWLSDNLASSDLVIFFILIGAGFLLILWNRAEGAKNVGWVAIPLFTGLLLWFLIGPAIRFGAGYIWSLGLTVFSAGLAVSRRAAARRAVGFVLILCILSFVPRRQLVYFGLPPVRKAFRQPETFLMQLPIPRANTTPEKSSNGVTIHVPNDGTYDCWLSDLPCTPGFPRNLVVVYSDRGFKMFYIAK